jgi:hypothetical protein
LLLLLEASHWRRESARSSVGRLGRVWLSAIHHLL